MPPFLAQGMCSGFRDAYNIAWKLDLVLKGLAGPGFLDTYEAERGPNSRATIVESLRVGLNVNERDPQKARARDEQLMALQAAKDRGEMPKALIAFRVPGFEDGFVARKNGAKGAGEVFGQGRVARNGEEGLFDDVAGRGFMVIARNGDPAAALSADDRAYWDALGGRFVTMGDGTEAVSDTEGHLSALMDTYSCDVMVKRPDYYLFGACPKIEDLPGLLAELRNQLGATT
jgi:hypothetical protein